VAVGVTGFGDGILVGMGVDLGASPVWVTNCSTAACVAVASRSSWDLPQATSIMVIKNPPRNIPDVFFWFIVYPPNLTWLLSGNVIISNENCQIKDNNCQKVPISRNSFVIKGLRNRSKTH
jgi:hypothetical protein